MKILTAHTIAIIAGLYALISWFLQIHIFAFLIRLQAEYIGNYFSMITGMVMVVTFWGLPLLLILGRDRFKAKDTNELTEEVFRKNLKKPCKIILLLLFGCLALGGLSFYWSQNTSTTEEVVIDLSEPVDRPIIGKNSLWFKKITLQGKPLVSQSYLIETSGKRGRTSYDLYTPIQPVEGDQPIQFVHNLSGSDQEDINPNKILPTGYIIPFAVPVLVRDDFAAQGLTLADHVYIIGTSELDEKTAAYICTGVCGLFAFSLLIALVTLPIGNRKKLKAWKAANSTNVDTSNSD